MHQSSFHTITRFKDLVAKHYPNANDIIQVLDVGSYGVNGTFKEIFADTSRFHYVGLDVSAGPNVDYVPKDPYAWHELADASFDVIISGQAFEHIEFPWLIIEEMDRVVKPNGLICIIAPSRGPEHKYPVDCWRYYPDGFRALAKWVGLEVLEAKTFWGATGFSDGSDQWGDTLCILFKNPQQNRTVSVPNRRHGSPPAPLLNKSNPLRLSRNNCYYQFPRAEVVAFIKKSGYRTNSVLEIGCAGGATGKLLKESLPNTEYVGVELSEAAANEARKHLDRVVIADFEKEDLGNHGIVEGTFDAVLALDVLEHLYDPWDALSRLTRYLNPGGHIVASIPNVRNVTVLRELLSGTWKYEAAGILDATHLRFFSRNDVDGMMRGAGLSLKHLEVVINPPLDMNQVKEHGNTLHVGKATLTDLSRSDMIDLHTYQYIVGAAMQPAYAGSPPASPPPDAENALAGDHHVIEWPTIVSGRTSIIILTYNQLQYTKECCTSLSKCTPEDHEIIFVDNCSTDGTKAWLKDLASKNRNYRLIENASNLGFARGCNQGIETATGEYILLLNNDVVVTEDWLSGMLECLQSDSDMGIVGPMTNSISGPQKVAHVDYTALSGLNAYANTFREQHRHRRIPFRRIVGFSMLFRRELVEKIGLLDESFGTGNYEDDDFCLRAALAGYRNFIAGDVFIHHYGSRSFIGNDIHYGSAMTGNRKTYNAKWGAVRANSTPGKALLVIQALEKAAELLRKDQTENALMVLIDAIKYAPDDMRIYSNLANILLETKQFEQALEVIEKMPPDEADAHRLCIAGYCKEGLGSYEEASTLATRALSLRPGYAIALNLQGVIAFKKEDRVTAEALFRKAMEADPGYGEPFTNLGVLFWSQGDHQAGLDFLEKGFILAPLSPDAASLYHSAATTAGAFGRAESTFQEACSLYPDLRRVCFLLIDIMLRQEKHAAALAMTLKAMIAFGIDDGILAAALDIRSKIGTKEAGRSRTNKDTLSICLIVKNEEAYLPKCLMSIVALADEIIVVDTGSTDRTKDIALAFGAQVFSIPWTGDFSEARNTSLEKAKSGWIFILDADEVISPRDHAALKKLIHTTRKRPAAFAVTTRNYITAMNISGWTANDGTYGAEEAGSGWNPSTKTRLFTNDPRIRFENRVHELVERSLARIGVDPQPCDIPVHHYGKLKEDKVMTKGEDYFLLGREKLRETNDAKALYELALQAGELDRFSDAIELWEQFLLLPDLPLELVLKAYINMGHAFVQTGRFEDAFTASKKAIELAPTSASAVINYGLSELWQGDPQRAVPFLEALLKTTPDYPPAIGLLAVAALASGKSDAARLLFEQLKTQGFLCEPYLLNHAQKLIAAGKPDRATAILEAAITSGLGSADLNRMLIECKERSAKRDNLARPIAGIT